MCYDDAIMRNDAKEFAIMDYHDPQSNLHIHIRSTKVGGNVYRLVKAVAGGKNSGQPMSPAAEARWITIIILSILAAATCGVLFLLQGSVLFATLAIVAAVVLFIFALCFRLRWNGDNINAIVNIASAVIALVGAFQIFFVFGTTDMVIENDILKSCFVNEPTVTVPEGVLEIDDCAFSGLWSTRGQKIETIILPESLEYINNGAFKNLKSLKEVQFGNHVISIGMNAFENCTNLRSITLPDSVEILGDYAFQKCTNLKEIQLGSGLLEIGTGAFTDCSSLRSLVIPDSVEKLNDLAFSQCTNLLEVQFGPKVMQLRPLIFSGATRLKTIHFNGTQEQYDSMDKFVHTNWTEGQGWEEWIAEKRIEILFAEEEVGS